MTFDTLPGVTYVVESSTSVDGPFEVVEQFEGDGTTQTIFDEPGLTARMFYQVNSL